MQELVELIRRDHAQLDDLAHRRDDGLPAALGAHAALLEATVGPLAEGLGDEAAREWAEAHRWLDAAARGEPEALAAHAEQMEQVVLPRLTAELTEEDLSDATREVMRRHEELGLGSSRPAAMRSELDAQAADDSRPAGTP